MSTFSPVWLAARYADDCPIVVLKPLAHEDFRFTRNVLGFIGELFHAGASARDWYNIQSDPRVSCSGSKRRCCGEGMSTQKKAVLTFRNKGKDLPTDSRFPFI